MATIETLSRKLRVGEELQSVVGTMKGLAAAEIHAYESAVQALREYTTTVEQGLQILLMTSPRMIPAPGRVEGDAVVLVVGTDQGLCGPINRQVAEAAAGWLGEHEPGRRHVVALGARVVRELEVAGVRPTQELALPGSVEAIAPAVEDLIVLMDRWRQSGELSTAVLFHQHPLSRTQQTPRMFQVHPPDVMRLRSIAERDWPTRMLPGSPHEPAELLQGLLRQDLFVALYRAIAEARAAEHGARLSAMQAAEQSIEDRLDALRTDYHQLRQAQITAELLDVISGFRAVRGSSRE